MPMAIVLSDVAPLRRQVGHMVAAATRPSAKDVLSQREVFGVEGERSKDSWVVGVDADPVLLVLLVGSHVNHGLGVPVERG